MYVSGNHWVSGNYWPGAQHQEDLSELSAVLSQLMQLRGQIGIEDPKLDEIIVRLETKILENLGKEYGPATIKARA